MNKKKLSLGIAIGATACMAAAYVGTAWYAGTQIEKHMDTSLRELVKANPVIKISDLSVKRGIFSTTHEMSVGINSDCFALVPADEKRPDLASLDKLKIRLRQEISHGPITFADGVRPGLAAYAGALVLDDATAQELKKLIGDQPVLSWKGHLNFGGEYQLTMNSPRFNVDSKDGKLAWDGINGTGKGNRQAKTYRLDLHAPRLSFHAAKAQADQPSAAVMENLRLSFDGRETKSQLPIGSGAFSIDKVSITESGSPNKGVIMNKFVYSADMKENGDYLDVHAGYNVEGVRVNMKSVGDKSFGPLAFELGFEHLHTQTLAELNKKLNSFMCAGKSGGESAAEGFNTLKDLMAVILKHDPVLRLKQLKIGAAEGDVQVQGKIALTGFQPAMLDNPQSVMTHLLDVVAVELNASASEKLLMSFAKDGAVTAAQRQMSLAPGESMEPEQIKAVQMEAEQSAKEKLALAVAQNFIKADGNRVSSSFSYSKGKSVLNGHPIQLPFLPVGGQAIEAVSDKEN